VLYINAVTNPQMTWCCIQKATVSREGSVPCLTATPRHLCRYTASNRVLHINAVPYQQVTWCCIQTVCLISKRLGAAYEGCGSSREGSVPSPHRDSPSSTSLDGAVYQRCALSANDLVCIKVGNDLVLHTKAAHRPARDLFPSSPRLPVIDVARRCCIPTLCLIS
jgi:hypothetical protein